MPGPRPTVLLARGHHPTVWNLRPWELLRDSYELRVMETGSARYDLSPLDLPRRRVRALRDRLPAGVAGDALALALGDRILEPDALYCDADIVHAEDLSLWFSAEAARLKRRYGYRLVLTVWETLPLLDAFRSRHARRWRRDTLAHTDLFVAATQRAVDGLRLEGVPAERIVLSHPGIDVARFRRPTAGGPPAGHVIVSPGRLEWEKGHHDVLRAVAALRRGLVPAPGGSLDGLRILLVGRGPEADRLTRHAGELGIADLVELTSVPYDEMPALFARASAMVLGSLPRSGCALHPGDVPRCFWEEQFGLVIAEAMAAGLPLVLSSSGAIPEVGGESADYFPPGDWMQLARRLAAGPLSRPPGTRADHPADRVEAYSIPAAARRLAAAYETVLSSASR